MARSHPVAGEGGRGQGRNRTSDTAVFSRVLYRLSYLAWNRPARRERTIGNRFNVRK